MRDFQKQKLYDWEHLTLPSGSPLHKEEAKRLMETVLTSYSTPPVTLSMDERRRRTSVYQASNHSIILAPFGIQRKTLLHELAHAILEFHPPPVPEPDHGPLFARLVIELYARYLCISETALIVSAEKTLQVANEPTFRDWKESQKGVPLS